MNVDVLLWICESSRVCIPRLQPVHFVSRQFTGACDASYDRQARAEQCRYLCKTSVDMRAPLYGSAPSHRAGGNEWQKVVRWRRGGYAVTVRHALIARKRRTSASRIPEHARGC